MPSANTETAPRINFLIVHSPIPRRYASCNHNSKTLRLHIAFHARSNWQSFRTGNKPVGNEPQFVPNVKCRFSFHRKPEISDIIVSKPLALLPRIFGALLRQWRRPKPCFGHLTQVARATSAK